MFLFNAFFITFTAISDESMPINLRPNLAAAKRVVPLPAKQSITTLLSLEDCLIKQALLLMLYFGLRPCEVREARFEGNFLIARNAKRKGGKIEYKKIPVPKQAREKFNLDAPILVPLQVETTNRAIKRILQNDTITQYYLRHTFSTVCQQYVRPDIVDIWMGDSSERLVGRVYTHFPDDFMQEQMEKVKFDI